MYEYMLDPCFVAVHRVVIILVNCLNLMRFGCSRYYYSFCWCYQTETGVCIPEFRHIQYRDDLLIGQATFEF